MYKIYQAIEIKQSFDTVRIREKTKKERVERDLHVSQGAVLWECCLWQHEHQSISKWISSDKAEKRREEERQAGREEAERGKHGDAQVLRIKKENGLRSAAQLWSKGSGLQRPDCGLLQHSLILLRNAAAHIRHVTNTKASGVLNGKKNNLKGANLLVQKLCSFRLLKNCFKFYLSRLYLAHNCWKEYYFFQHFVKHSP